MIGFGVVEKEGFCLVIDVTTYHNTDTSLEPM